MSKKEWLLNLKKRFFKSNSGNKELIKAYDEHGNREDPFIEELLNDCWNSENGFIVVKREEHE